MTVLLAAGLFGEVRLRRQIIVELGRFHASAAVLDLHVPLQGGLGAVAALTVLMGTRMALDDVLVASPLQLLY